MSWCSS